MSEFEITYQTDPSRELSHEREKHTCIELSDDEYLEKRGFVRTDKLVTFHASEPPSIPMNLEMPVLEKAIKQGKKNAKSKSKSAESKPKKNSPKSNRSTVARV